MVTLSGPDWKTPQSNPTDHWCDKQKSGGNIIITPNDMDGDGNAMDCVAILVDGVINVVPPNGKRLP